MRQQVDALNEVSKNSYNFISLLAEETRTSVMTAE